MVLKPAPFTAAGTSPASLDNKAMAKLYHYKDEIVFLRKSKDSFGGNLAIILISITEGYEERFANLTVNLGPVPDQRCAYIDTNNLNWGGFDVIAWGEKNRIFRKTKFSRQSGYCTYPLVQFTEAALADAEGVE